MNIINYNEELEKIKSLQNHHENESFEYPKIKFDVKDCEKMIKKLIENNFVKVESQDIVIGKEKGLVCFLEGDRKNETPIRKITNIPSYYVSKFLVSNTEYELFESLHRRPYSSKNDNDPVTGISYGKAIRYINWLNHNQSMKYRLPLEPEYILSVTKGDRDYSYQKNGAPLDGFENIRTSFNNNELHKSTIAVDNENSFNNYLGLKHSCGNVSIFSFGRYYTEYGSRGSENNGSYNVVLGGNFRQCKYSTNKITRGIIDIAGFTDNIGIRLYHTDPIYFINS